MLVASNAVLAVTDSNRAFSTSAFGGDRAPHIELVPDPEELSGVDSVRDVAIAHDRARGGIDETDRTEAEALWGSILAGQRSLVDVFNHEGRRYYVARRNAPSLVQRARLSHRETQIVAMVVDGYANKFIAYELGIAPTTVSSVLAKALAKLGLRSRIELAKLAPESIAPVLQQHSVLVSKPANVTATNGARR